ncbi:LytR/AlgR family response regulator transcription factor [Croceimicrobium hydrocarbonivorans]|uniref:Response regulator transcription factor n=1 Tax=Croceimicrobium hydrocarbonivorans TaxID=2761580 RepID=A0A7H0VHK2_9FLAO|nr:LytTR family DNA-binding domain-containing protein [Croceimicrobium hydrocarbonivorans]QNR25200.1 response regulator transcription factor [Croceimicrobium hydrocarbonivorans]
MKALIVDDEIHSAEITELQVLENCPDIKSAQICLKAEEAVDLLNQEDFDLLFLDIEMPKLSGFDVLKAVNRKLPAVIFTTAYDQFALNAFKVDAVDYLLKPIVIADLKRAVEKAISRIQNNQTRDLKQFIEEKLANTKSQKLAIGHMHGIDWVDFSEIIRCESESNYTQIITIKQNFLTAKTLKQVEAQLPEDQFIRAHASHLVNINFVKSYQRGSGGVLFMSNGDHVPVSRQQKTALLNKLGA